MITKKFADKRIIIRTLSSKDLKRPEEFKNYLNFLIDEDAQILMKNKKTKKEEYEWLQSRLVSIKNRKSVSLLAEYNDEVVGLCSVNLGRERQDHLGDFAISVKWGYRRIGLGKYLMKEIIKLAKKDLSPKPKIIKLYVFSGNKPAINLYKKMGFKEVAKLPKQIQYKGKLISETFMLLYL